MTPKFYSHFALLQRTLAAYNRKCDCKGVDVTIAFEQVLKTREDSNPDIWIAKFNSETFDNQRFGGTIERVSELVTIFIEQVTRQTLEACIANADEWYKDKPEIVEEIYNLYSHFKDLTLPN